MSQQEVEAQNDKNWEGWRQTSLSYFILALCGEVGELANAYKKFERFLLGWEGNKLNIQEFTEVAKSEIADIQIYLDLVAGKLGFNIEELVREKQKINQERFGWK